MSASSHWGPTREKPADWNRQGTNARLYDRNLSWPPVSRKSATNSIRRWASSVMRHACLPTPLCIPRHRLAAQHPPRLRGRVFTDLGNDVVNTKQQFNLASLYLESQDIVGVSVSHVTDRPDADFEIMTAPRKPPPETMTGGRPRSCGYLGMHRKLFLRPMCRVGGFLRWPRQQFRSDLLPSFECLLGVSIR